MDSAPAESPESERARPRRRRRWVWWVSASALVVVLLAAAAVWVGLRAATARSELTSAEESARALPDLIVSGDAAATEAAASSFTDHAAKARAATGDPVWRVAEVVPWLGRDLAAVRGVAEIADDIATGALPPLQRAAGVLDPAALAPRDGVIDTAPLAAASPDLDAAAAVLDDAAARAAALPTGVLAPVTDAVGQLTYAAQQAAGTVDAVDRAAAVLPTMLGSQGPRTYLFRLLNNAESRSQGGIAGALTVLHADGGRLSLSADSYARDVEIAPAPVIALSDSTVALFDQLPARYMQDTVMPIDLDESARAAVALWQHTYGGTIDGVITVDAPTAAYLLQATGPVDAGGITVTADNAVETLLSTAYRVVPDPEQLDHAYAAIAGAIFGAAMSSGTEPRALLEALAKAAGENRVHVWSAHPDEQARLAGTTLTTLLPEDAASPAVGVFANDESGGKLDFYARMAVTLQTAVCDAAPRLRVTVDWTNGAPADALASLPPYVTIGSQDGTTRTSITVAGPAGWTPRSYAVDEVTGGSRTALFDDRVAVQQTFSTPFQATRRVTVEFSGPEGASDAAPAVVATPMVAPVAVTTGTLSCDAPQPTASGSPSP